MPPSKRFQKEEILDAAYEIAKNRGYDEINARELAKMLNSSVQPIYHNFETMDAVKNAVRQRIYELYVHYMREGARNEKAYLGMGLAYIQFAKDYPNFFRLLFMSESGLSPEEFIIQDDFGNQVIAEGQKFSGMSREEQRKFHVKVWFFTHGIATIVANGTAVLGDQMIEELLRDTIGLMLRGMLTEQKEREGKE